MGANTSRELELLPQGDKVPGDAQEFKDELNRITKYVTYLQEKTKNECDKNSEDVKFWAEYRTGIKEFSPWLVKAEAASTEGLSKPSNLDEASALAEKVHGFEKACVDHLKVLEAADSAAKKVATLVKEWQLLDNTVTELNTWVAKDKTSEGENQFSLEKMESTLGELKNIFKQKEKLVDGL